MCVCVIKFSKQLYRKAGRPTKSQLKIGHLVQKCHGGPVVGQKPREGPQLSSSQAIHSGVCLVLFDATHWSCVIRNVNLYRFGFGDTDLFR